MLVLFCLACILSLATADLTRNWNITDLISAANTTWFAIGFAIEYEVPGGDLLFSRCTRDWNDDTLSLSAFDGPAWAWCEDLGSPNTTWRFVPGGGDSPTNFTIQIMHAEKDVPHINNTLFKQAIVHFSDHADDLLGSADGALVYQMNCTKETEVYCTLPSGTNASLWVDAADGFEPMGFLTNVTISNAFTSPLYSDQDQTTCYYNYTIVEFQPIINNTHDAMECYFDFPCNYSTSPLGIDTDLQLQCGSVNVNLSIDSIVTNQTTNTWFNIYSFTPIQRVNFSSLRIADPTIPRSTWNSGLILDLFDGPYLTGVDADCGTGVCRFWTGLGYLMVPNSMRMPYGIYPDINKGCWGWSQVEGCPVFEQDIIGFYHSGSDGSEGGMRSAPVVEASVEVGREEYANFQWGMIFG